MPTFYVTQRRAEEIVYRIEATDADDAEERFLSDGDETFSETVDDDVIGVQLVDPASASV